jgi:molecular chaperone GrpE
MADETRKFGEDTPEVALDLDEQSDLDTAMREAVAAVEEVENGGRPDDPANPSSTADETSHLRQEIADLRDRSMRTLADFDNFRKRAERERQDLKRYALVEPMREFLTVVDNLDLALSAGGSAEDLKRGVEMIHRQMHDLLRRLGVREVESVGQAFDPALHEAVAREEDPTVKVPTVSGELRRGYLIHDRLLRPAMVKVAVPAESAVRGVNEEDPL